MINQAVAEEVDHLALPASQKRGEQQEVSQARAEATVFTALKGKLESLMDSILDKRNIHTELKNMAKSTNMVLKELIKVQQSPKPEKIVSSS